MFKLKAESLTMAFQTVALTCVYDIVGQVTEAICGGREKVVRRHTAKTDFQRK